MFLQLKHNEKLMKSYTCLEKKKFQVKLTRPCDLGLAPSDSYVDIDPISAKEKKNIG